MQRHKHKIWQECFNLYDVHCVKANAAASNHSSLNNDDSAAAEDTNNDPRKVFIIPL